MDTNHRTRMVMTLLSKHFPLNVFCMKSSMLKYKDNIRHTRLWIIKYRRERARDSDKTMKYMFLSITMYFYVGLCISILPTIKVTAL